MGFECDNLLLLKKCCRFQLAMMAVMGQTGFYVPATSSVQPLFDGVYLRVGARDDMWSGRSTLMVEVQLDPLYLAHPITRCV